MTNDTSGLVERVAEQLAYGDKMQARDVALDRDDVRAVLALLEQRTEALRLMPDYIEVFRIMQATGGKRATMAMAIAQRIEELRTSLNDKEPSDGD